MSAQQKEDRLFENIYLSYFPKMKRFAQEYVISEQDAENIVQDMFAELWEKREMFTCQTIRIAYLFTIIKNKCLNHLRHKTIALETINNMQEEYNMTLRMNLDSLEAFEQHIFSDQDIEDLINRALDKPADQMQGNLYHEQTGREKARTDRHRTKPLNQHGQKSNQHRL